MEKLKWTILVRFLAMLLPPILLSMWYGLWNYVHGTAPVASALTLGPFSIPEVSEWWNVLACAVWSVFTVTLTGLRRHRDTEAILFGMLLRFALGVLLSWGAMAILQQSGLGGLLIMALIIGVIATVLLARELEVLADVLLLAHLATVLAVGAPAGLAVALFLGSSLLALYLTGLASDTRSAS